MHQTTLAHLLQPHMQQQPLCTGYLEEELLQEWCVPDRKNIPKATDYTPACVVRSHRALRVMRISLLAGELQAMRLSSSGALLSGAASSRLFQLITSVLTLLFTTSSIVSHCLSGVSSQSQG